MPVKPDPPRDCPRCPRLVAYRQQWRATQPDWWNAPVEGWGDTQAWLLIVGLAPGLRGGNRTGRPFTGDASGAFLYPTLIKFGLAEGHYQARSGDRLRLRGTFITNAAACVPPENRPTPEEVRNCRPFLHARLASLPRLRAVIALGAVAHDSLVRALGATPSQHRFAHGARHEMPGRLTLIDSYHCSRQNTNTGRLTRAMFENVFAAACELQPVD